MVTNFSGTDCATLTTTLQTWKAFAKEHLPLAKRLEWDRQGLLPEAILRKMLAPGLALHRLFLPREYQGLGGSGYDIYRFCEEMAKIDLGLATALLSISLGADPLRVAGTPEQQRRWLEKIATEGLIVAYGVTEPSAGSDLAALRTQADPLYGSDGQIVAYRLNGIKKFITNGGIADLYSILALTPAGPSFFIVEKGCHGLGSGRPEDKHGIRLSHTCHLTFNDVEIPAAHLIGAKEGEGLAQAVAVFGYTRLMVAAFGLGAGEAALTIALKYATRRKLYGKRLIEMPAYTYKLLIPHAVRLEVARAYIEEVVHRLDRGETNLETEGAIAKLFATEAGNQAADAALQACGGYGYMRAYEIEKIRRDVRVTTIYEGTSEIMQQTVAKNRWRDFLQTKGGCYHALAQTLAQLAATNPDCGAAQGAKAIEVVSAALEYIRQQRLTRQPFILLKMAEMMVAVETAAALCHRANRLQDQAAPATDYIKTAARLYAAETAGLVAQTLFFYLPGFAAKTAAEIANVWESLGLKQLAPAYLGFGEDMEKMAHLVGENWQKLFTRDGDHDGSHWTHG